MNHYHDNPLLTPAEREELHVEDLRRRRAHTLASIPQRIGDYGREWTFIRYEAYYA